jgi:hypothetical protein
MKYQERLSCDLHAVLCKDEEEKEHEHEEEEEEQEKEHEMKEEEEEEEHIGKKERQEGPFLRFRAFCHNSRVLMSARPEYTYIYLYIIHMCMYVLYDV